MAVLRSFVLIMIPNHPNLEYSVGSIHLEYAFQPHFGKCSIVVQSLCYTIQTGLLVEGEGHFLPRCRSDRNDVDLFDSNPSRCLIHPLLPKQFLAPVLVDGSARDTCMLFVDIAT